MSNEPSPPPHYWQFLQEAIRSGSFGSVRLGMSRDEVRACLGAPDATGGTSRKQRLPRILKYGEVELHFDMLGKVSCFFWEDANGNWIAVNEKGSQVHQAEKE